MTQFEIVQNRVNTARLNAESGIVNRISAPFTGLDERVTTATDRLIKALADIKANKDFTTPAKQQKMTDADTSIMGPVKAEYLSALEKAKQIMQEALTAIETAALPASTDSSDDRAANIALIQAEMSVARDEDWPQLVRDNADNTDVMKLVDIFAKTSTAARDARDAVRMEIMKAGSSKLLTRFSKSLNSLMPDFYAWDLPGYFSNVQEDIVNPAWQPRAEFKMDFWRTIYSRAKDGKTY